MYGLMREGATPAINAISLLVTLAEGGIAAFRPRLALGRVGAARRPRCAFKDVDPILEADLAQRRIVIAVPAHRCDEPWQAARIADGRRDGGPSKSEPKPTPSTPTCSIR